MRAIVSPAANIKKTRRIFRVHARPARNRIVFHSGPYRELPSFAGHYGPAAGRFSVSSAHSATGNLFLDKLPANVMDALRPSLTQVVMAHGSIIYDRDKPIDKVLFPINSILSVVLDMSDGDTAEVGIIGREGMSGLALVLGMSQVMQRTIVQVPNGALSMPADDFRAAIEREPELKAVSLRYAQATLTTTSQLSACNTLHPINERCARWLLMAHDRVDGDLVLLTQEFLSQMLGVRRGGVTLAASALQEAGLISYSRGHINVRNRAGLELASCECYEMIEQDWQTVMGYPVRKERTPGPNSVPLIHQDGAAGHNVHRGSE